MTWPRLASSVLVIAVNACNGSRLSRAPFETPFNGPSWAVPGYPAKYSLFPLSTRRLSTSCQISSLCYNLS